MVVRLISMVVLLISWKSTRISTDFNGGSTYFMEIDPYFNWFQWWFYLFHGNRQVFQLISMVFGLIAVKSTRISIDFNGGSADFNGVWTYFMEIDPYFNWFQWWFYLFHGNRQVFQLISMVFGLIAVKSTRISIDFNGGSADFNGDSTDFMEINSYYSWFQWCLDLFHGNRPVLQLISMVARLISKGFGLISSKSTRISIDFNGGSADFMEIDRYFNWFQWFLDLFHRNRPVFQLISMVARLISMGFGLISWKSTGISIDFNGFWTDCSEIDPYFNWFQWCLDLLHGNRPVLQLISMVFALISWKSTRISIDFNGNCMCPGSFVTPSASLIVHFVIYVLLQFLSVKSDGILSKYCENRCLLVDGFCRLGWLRATVYDRIWSDLFRQNPDRNPLVRIPVKTGSDLTGFISVSGDFRSVPISDFAWSWRIRRSDWMSWVMKDKI